MGKRSKKTKAPKPKKRERMEKQFTCIICNHEGSVSCKIDKGNGLGYLSCKVCGQSFQATTDNLSAPIDVYSAWVDACEDISKLPRPDSEEE